MNARLTFLHALSPLHAGTGQGAGIIDLPIAREKATGLPFLPGSSLKGVLRASFDEKDRKWLFGPDTSEVQTENNHASSVQFSDQRLLLLPVRSLVGTFAWVTSPYILRRLLRDIQDTEATPPAAIPTIEEKQTCAIAATIAEAQQESKIKVERLKVYLEDLELDGQEMPDVNTWATWISGQVFPGDEIWQRILIERMCIVHDDIFNFIIDIATEITARIKLQEDAKTVQDGGLWYEEALPTETILSGIALAIPTKASQAGADKVTVDKVFSTLNGKTGKLLQFGGKATVGRGLCHIQISKQAGAKGEASNANA